MFRVIHQYGVATISYEVFGNFVNAGFAADVIGDGILEELYDPTIGRHSLPKVIYYNNQCDFIAIRIDTPCRHYISVFKETDNV